MGKWVRWCRALLTPSCTHLLPHSKPTGRTVRTIQGLSGSNDIFLAGLQGAQPRVQCWRSREGGETFNQQRSDGLLDGERGASGGEGGGDDGVGAQVHGQVPRLPRGGGELGGLELLSTSGCLMSTCHLQDLFTEPHLCPESPKVRRQRIRHAGAAGELSLIAFFSLNKARHWLEEA